jgi:hypothetical protein
VRALMTIPYWLFWAVATLICGVAAACSVGVLRLCDWAEKLGGKQPANPDGFHEYRDPDRTGVCAECGKSPKRH